MKKLSTKQITKVSGGNLCGYGFSSRKWNTKTIMGEGQNNFNQLFVVPLPIATDNSENIYRGKDLQRPCCQFLVNSRLHPHLFSDDRSPEFLGQVYVMLGQA